MKTKSNVGSSGIARSASSAGPTTISTRSASPASARFARAIAAYSSETSRQVSAPPSASPRAIEIAP